MRVGRRLHDRHKGALRLVFPTPTWDDYLALAFDEIRQFGSSSVQVMRRLRATLLRLLDSLWPLLATRVEERAHRLGINGPDLEPAREALGVVASRRNTRSR